MNRIKNIYLYIKKFFGDIKDIWDYSQDGQFGHLYKDEDEDVHKKK